jgi:hypothetical protein
MWQQCAHFFFKKPVCTCHQWFIFQVFDFAKFVNIPTPKEGFSIKGCHVLKTYLNSFKN